MKSQANLNTSCKATFKNGQTKEFSSIEEASKETGISIQAIKIRCNKPGTGGKDGTQFEWLDEHTKLSYRAKKSRNKGKDLEYFKFALFSDQCMLLFVKRIFEIFLIFFIS